MGAVRYLADVCPPPRRQPPDEDAAELDRLRRLLCLPKADVDQLHRDICGRIFQEVRAACAAVCMLCV